MPGNLSVGKVSKYLLSTSSVWHFPWRWGRVAVKQATKWEPDRKVQNR